MWSILCIKFAVLCEVWIQTLPTSMTSLRLSLSPCNCMLVHPGTCYQRDNDMILMYCIRQDCLCQSVKVLLYLKKWRRRRNSPPIFNSNWSKTSPNFRGIHCIIIIVSIVFWLVTRNVWKVLGKLLSNFGVNFWPVLYSITNNNNKLYFSIHVLMSFTSIHERCVIFWLQPTESISLCFNSVYHCKVELFQLYCFSSRRDYHLFIFTFPWRNIKMTQIRGTQIVLEGGNVSAFSVSKHVMLV